MERIGIENEIDGYVNNSMNIFDLYIKLFNLLCRIEGDVIDLEDSIMEDRFLEEKADYYIKVISEIFEEDNFTINLSDDNKKELLQIPQYTEDRREESVLLYVLILFKKIDEIIGKNAFIENSTSYFDDDGQPVVEVLPLNTEETIELGKVYCKEENFIQKYYEYNQETYPRKNLEVGSTIKNHMKNLIIVKNKDNDLKVKLNRINYNRTLKFLNEKNSELNIALVPFTNDQRYVRFNFNEHGSKFVVDSLYNIDKYIIKTIEILKKLNEKKTHIAVFPEFVFNTEMLKEIQLFLRNEKNTFSMIIFGSIWEEASNKCIILSGDGKILGYQNKLNKFHKSIAFHEIGNNEGISIATENRILNIYDIKGLGRINTAICVDFVSDNYFDNLLNMDVNLCFTPTYTQSLHAFDVNANRIGSSNYGTVFLCNSCIPIRYKMLKSVKEEKQKKELINQKEDKLLFAYVPIKGIGIKYMKCCNCNEQDCNYNYSKICCYFTTFRNNSCDMKKINL